MTLDLLFDRAKAWVCHLMNFVIWSKLLNVTEHNFCIYKIGIVCKILVIIIK